jgi:hypothetical protein
MSCVRSLVEVMRLGGGCGHVQPFDVLGSDVDDLIDVLQRSFDQQEGKRRPEAVFTNGVLRVGFKCPSTVEPSIRTSTPSRSISSFHLRNTSSCVR